MNFSQSLLQDNQKKWAKALPNDVVSFLESASFGKADISKKLEERQSETSVLEQNAPPEAFCYNITICNYMK